MSEKHTGWPAFIRPAGRIAKAASAGFKLIELVTAMASLMKSAQAWEVTASKSSGNDRENDGSRLTVFSSVRPMALLITHLGAAETKR